jgi:hypothetical protein
MTFRAEALTKGRYDLLGAEYLYPLPVVVCGQALTLANSGAAEEFFEAVHRGLRSLGLSRLRCRVAAQSLPFGGQARIWTDWFAEGMGKPEALVASTICDMPLQRDSRTVRMEFTMLHHDLLTLI